MHNTYRATDPQLPLEETIETDLDKILNDMLGFFSNRDLRLDLVSDEEFIQRGLSREQSRISFCFNIYKDQLDKIREELGYRLKFYPVEIGILKTDNENIITIYIILQYGVDPLSFRILKTR